MPKIEVVRNIGKVTAGHDLEFWGGFTERGGVGRFQGRMHSTSALVAIKSHLYLFRVIRLSKPQSREIV